MIMYNSCDEDRINVYSEGRTMETEMNYNYE